MVISFFSFHRSSPTVLLHHLRSSDTKYWHIRAPSRRSSLTTSSCSNLDSTQYPGMVGLAGMGLILISAVIKLYEAAYMLHAICAASLLFGVGVHRPDSTLYSTRAIISTAAFFALDRVILWACI